MRGPGVRSFSPLVRVGQVQTAGAGCRQEGGRLGAALKGAVVCMGRGAVADLAPTERPHCCDAVPPIRHGVGQLKADSAMSEADLTPMGLPVFTASRNQSRERSPLCSPYLAAMAAIMAARPGPSAAPPHSGTDAGSGLCRVR